MSGTVEQQEMWERACVLTRLVAHSVKCAESAGKIMKKVITDNDMQIVNKGTAEAKDLQTKADRSIQYLIERSLKAKFGNTLKVIGEEDNVNEVADLEDRVCSNVLKEDVGVSTDQRALKVEDFVIWVDPLDGTLEFAKADGTDNPNLIQVTTLIGICHRGEAIAGVIHQPFYGNEGRTIWGILGVGQRGIDIQKADPKKIVVTTRSHFTDLIQDSLTTLKEKKLADDVEKCGGAGYKVIRLFEGRTAYVFPAAGCKKWDTAAPEAIIRAAGGDLTDVSGRRIQYHEDVQHLNSGGVLATAPHVNHGEYLSAIPEHVKKQLPETVSKS